MIWAWRTRGTTRRLTMGNGGAKLMWSEGFEQRVLEIKSSLGKGLYATWHAIRAKGLVDPRDPFPQEPSNRPTPISTITTFHHCIRTETHIRLCFIFILLQKYLRQRTSGSIWRCKAIRMIYILLGFNQCPSMISYYIIRAHPNDCRKSLIVLTDNEVIRAYQVQCNNAQGRIGIEMDNSHSWAF